MGRRKEPLRFVCRSCGKEQETYSTSVRGIYCNKQCKADYERKGEASPRRYKLNGYWRLGWTEPGGTKDKPNRKSKFEHVKVWEDHNGPLPAGYVVHHINGDKLDNRIENLQSMRRGDHGRYHNSQPDKYPGGGTSVEYTRRWRAAHPEYKARHAELERERRKRRKMAE
jgi:hypothetical protein